VTPRTWIVASALATALMAAGCGGGHDNTAPATTAGGPPKPKEPLAAAAKRLERALPTRDCKQLGALMLHSVRRGLNVPPSKPPTAAECKFILREARVDLEGFKVARVRQFGPAGMVEGSGPRARGKNVIGTVWSMDVDRSWKLLFDAILRPQIGVRPRPGFENNARAFVAAVLTRNCPLVFRGLNVASRFVRAANGHRATFCRQFLPAYKAKGNGIADLAANPDVKPEQLGATRDISFFGLDLKSGRYMVLTLAGRVGGIADAEQKDHADPSVFELLTVRRPD
jgi:hypothetical protein